MTIYVPLAVGFVGGGAAGVFGTLKYAKAKAAALADKAALALRLQEAAQKAQSLVQEAKSDAANAINKL